MSYGNRGISSDIDNGREPGINTMKGYDHTRFSNDMYYSRLVRMGAHYYDNMRDLRKKWVRNIDYYMGRQLNDTIVSNGRTIKVKDYMEMKGMAALSCDILTDKMMPLKGLVRQQYMAPSCRSVDSNESDVVETFNEMLRQNCNNNNKSEHDADQFEQHILLGFICDKVKWAFRNGREDVFVDAVDPFKLAVPVFSRKDLEDIEFIAEAHDVTWPKMLQYFVKKPGDEQKLIQIYTNAKSDTPTQGYNDTGMSQTNHLDDFYHSSVIGKYRFIEVWTLERNRALWCHDRLNASAGYRQLNEKAAIDAENRQRLEDNIMKDEDGQIMYDENGNVRTYIPEEEVPLIEYELGIEELWWWRMLSPNGYLLDEGLSPYKVIRNGYSFYFHPYTFLAYPCIQGEIRSYEDRLIDRQRQYNHDNILLEFMIMNQAKGVLAIDEEALSDDMNSIEDIAEQYAKVDGIILYTSKKNGQIPKAIQEKSVPAGAELLIQRDRELMTAQSGIQPALQGVHVGSNTSEGRYQMERQGAATSVADYVASFNNFELRVGKKQLWVMQCFYTDQHSVQITGKSIRQKFNTQTMGDVDFDMAMTLDSNSAVIREALKDLAWQSYLRDEIDFHQMLESADFGDTNRLKQFWKEHQEQKRQQAMAQQQAGMMGGAPTGLSAQVPGASRANGADRLLQADQGGTGVLVGTGGPTS